MRSRDIVKKTFVTNENHSLTGNYVFSRNELDAYVDAVLREQRLLIYNYIKKNTGLHDEYMGDVLDVCTNAPKPKHR